MSSYWICLFLNDYNILDNCHIWLTLSYIEMTVCYTTNNHLFCVLRMKYIRFVHLASFIIITLELQSVAFVFSGKQHPAIFEKPKRLLNNNYRCSEAISKILLRPL